MQPEHRASEAEAPAAGAPCANCGQPASGAYCSACGQPSGLGRITLAGLGRQMPRQRGLWRTLLGLARDPARTVNGYLDGQRIDRFNPWSLLTLMAGLAALLYTNHRLDFAPVVQAMPGTTDPVALARYLELNFRYRTVVHVISLPLLAVITWVAFAGRGRNLAEHLVINVYLGAALNAQFVLLFGLLVALDGRPGFATAWFGGNALIVLYKAFALYLIFDRRGQHGATLARTAVAVAGVLAIAALLPDPLTRWIAS